MSCFVSILIPCYNAQAWVAQAIESALAQTWPDKEVIVVDDGSTDRSLEIIRSFGGRIRWETGPNQGGNVARNRLLELARGNWLQYLDADDYLLPEKVSDQAAFLEQNSSTDVVFGPVIMEHCLAKESRREVRPIPEPHDPWILLARWYLPQTGAALWRKQAVLEVGNWKPDQPCCQEHELYLRLLMAGKIFSYLPCPGAVYRQWSENTVCKRDKPAVRRRRLEIERRAENYLLATGQLTARRHWAINQARFEMARLAWQQDHAEAMQILGALKESAPGFLPGGEAAPGTYQLLWRLLGFRVTETIADWRRRWASVSATQ